MWSRYLNKRNEKSVSGELSCIKLWMILPFSSFPDHEWLIDLSCINFNSIQLLHKLLCFQGTTSINICIRCEEISRITQQRWWIVIVYSSCVVFEEQQRFQILWDKWHSVFSFWVFHSRFSFGQLWGVMRGKYFSIIGMLKILNRRGPLVPLK